MVDCVNALFDSIRLNFSIGILLGSYVNCQQHALDGDPSTGCLVFSQLIAERSHILGGTLEVREDLGELVLGAKARNLQASVEAIHHLHLLQDVFHISCPNNHQFPFWVLRLLLDKHKQGLQDSVRKPWSNVDEFNKPFDVIKDNDAHRTLVSIIKDLHNLAYFPSLRVPYKALWAYHFHKGELAIEC